MSHTNRTIFGSGTHLSRRDVEAIVELSATGGSVYIVADIAERDLINAVEGDHCRTDDTGNWYIFNKLGAWSSLGGGGGGGGSVDTVTNASVGDGALVTGTATDPTIKRIIDGTGLTLTQNATSVTINRDAMTLENLSNVLVGVPNEGDSIVYTSGQWERQHHATGHVHDIIAAGDVLGTNDTEHQILAVDNANNYFHTLIGVNHLSEIINYDMPPTTDDIVTFNAGGKMRPVSALAQSKVTDLTTDLANKAETTHTIESHGDVTLTSLANGQTLVYNGSIWENKMLTALSSVTQPVSEMLGFRSEVHTPFGDVWFYREDFDCYGETPPLWHDLAYAGGPFTLGVTPIGFGVNGGITLATTISGAGSPDTFYVHRNITLTNVHDILALTFFVLSDDAVAIYFNGVLVKAYNVTPPLTHATFSDDAVADAAEPSYILHIIPKTDFTAIEGVNRVAFAVFNNSNAGNDMIFDCEIGCMIKTSVKDIAEFDLDDTVAYQDNDIMRYKVATDHWTNEQLTMDDIHYSVAVSNVVATYGGNDNLFDSTGTNHFTASGTALYTTGKHSNCFNLNGSWHPFHATIGGFNGLVEDYSWEFWYKSAAIAYSTNISRELTDSTQKGYVFQHESASNSFLCKITGDASSNNYKLMQFDTGVIDDALFHHIIVTWNIVNLFRVYVDGVITAVTFTSTQDLTVTSQSAGVFKLGERGDGSSPLTGQIDTLRLYDKELDVLEVVSLYNGGSGIDASNSATLAAILADKASATHTHTIGEISDVDTPLVGDDQQYLRWNNGTSSCSWETPPAGGSGEVNTLTSIGGETSIVSAKVGVDLQVRSFKSTTGTIGFSITDTIDCNVDNASIINDTGATATDIWSGSKLTTDLSGKSDTSHAHTLNDLTGVTITAASIHEVLYHNGSNWQDKQLSTNHLLDVDATAIGNDKILVYKTASGKHEYETPSGGGATTLASLTDTTIVTPVNKEILTYDTTWKNISIDHSYLSDNGTTTHAAIDTHIGLTEEHKTPANTDLEDLGDVGVVTTVPLSILWRNAGDTAWEQRQPFMNIVPISVNTTIGAAHVGSMLRLTSAVDISVFDSILGFPEGGEVSLLVDHAVPTGNILMKANTISLVRNETAHVGVTNIALDESYAVVVLKLVHQLTDRWLIIN